jgi:hypothetical protein
MKNKELYPMRKAQFLKDGLTNLMDYLEKQIGPLSEKSIIEIGSYAGESSEMFAQRFGFVICIDPWIDNYDLSDATCHHAPLSVAEKAFDLTMAKHFNVLKVKLTSDEASKLMSDYSVENVDFVYIDGMHTYEQVSKDIDNFSKYLKSPKIIGGHDYHENWPGVKKAIDDKLGIPDIIFCDTSWIKKI